MDVSLLQAHNECAVIALAVTLVYLLLICFLTLLANALRRFSGGRRPVARPGEEVHQALKLTGRLWDHCRTAALLFLVSLVLPANFGRSGWWVPLSLAANIFVTCALAGALLAAVLKILQLHRYRIRLGGLLYWLER